MYCYVTIVCTVKIVDGLAKTIEWFGNRMNDTIGQVGH